MSIDSSVYIRRNKLRRVFETEFAEINKTIATSCAANGVERFFVKYSPHLLDRAIQREIDEQYVFTLFKLLHNHVTTVVEFLKLPALPDVEDDKVEGVEYRPLRLEITDRNLWLGMTVDRPTPGRLPSLCCRMAFINNRRLEGKISTKVIDLI
ncbi:endoribonuclease [Edwardsiella phage PEi20]|uniref:Site-specific RNA endonuclease n=2 Tax=Kanagawavirus pei20 TaxID=2844109 RepID=A0A0B6VLI8_9CAUD|nr:endoribonuclease [Edwardsiella phage PEi20]BAQ22770.1 site-specific RNA endonuclease [Edwardsiella phage PEi20]BAQ23072.1 site-specific RNA endonuclease [Edwardsiella phage PEi26]